MRCICTCSCSTRPLDEAHGHEADMSFVGFGSVAIGGPGAPAAPADAGGGGGKREMTGEGALRSHTILKAEGWKGGFGRVVLRERNDEGATGLDLDVVENELSGLLDESSAADGR